jgi:hypothetical protein
MRERNSDSGLRTLAENGRGRERGRTLASLSSIKQGGPDSGVGVRCARSDRRGRFDGILSAAVIRREFEYSFSGLFDEPKRGLSSFPRFEGTKSKTKTLARVARLDD